MAARLACDLPELFAGVVLYASGLDATKCSAAARVPVLVMQGDADVIVPFAGGVNSAGVAFPGFAATAKSWVARNQCLGPPTSTSFNVTGGGSRDDNYKVDAAQYDKCAAGGDVAVWRILNGQHFALPATSAVLFGKALDWVMSQ